MIEILVLVRFCKRLAEIARSKHRSGSWGAVGAVGWIGGEVSGAIVGVKSSTDGASIYVFAILGAIIGALLAYAIVKTRSVLPLDPDFPTATVVR